MKLPNIKNVIIQDLPFANWVYASIVINVLLILSGLLIHRVLPPEIPLFYQMAEGEGQIANSFLIILPNSISLTVTVINAIIAKKIETEFYRKILITTGLMVTFFATVTTIKIILLVGSL